MGDSRRAPLRAFSSAELVRPPEVASDSIVRVLRVSAEDAGSRVDVFLSEALRSTSRTRAKLIAAHCAYSPTGRRLKPSERLRAEDHVVLWRRPIDDLDPELSVGILHEDPHLLALDKPPNITVHPTARHYHATITQLLALARPQESLNLIHRLDKETSGVLLVARGAAADRAFKRLFEGFSDPVGSSPLGSSPPGSSPLGSSPPGSSPPPPSALPVRAPTGGRSVEKTYLAICWGHPPSGLVDLPLEPEPDSSLRVKMRVAPRGAGLASKTELQTLAQSARYSLVRCRLLTGRQHQIRVHLAALGCPVVGDKLYGPDERMLARAADGELTETDLARLEHPRHALHAARYTLPHAITGEWLSVTAPLPPDLIGFWNDHANVPLEDKVEPAFLVAAEASRPVLRMPLDASEM